MHQWWELQLHYSSTWVVLHRRLNKKKKLLRRIHAIPLLWNIEIGGKTSEESQCNNYHINQQHITFKRRQWWWLRRSDTQKASKALQWQFLNVGGSSTRPCLISILWPECMYIWFFSVCVVHIFFKLKELRRKMFSRRTKLN